MTPPLGQRVLYKLAQHDIDAIERNRDNRGVQVANLVRVGDTYPADVVRTFTADVANLQVLLDGPDTHWVTSRTQGDEPGQWTLLEEGLPLLGELELVSDRPSLGQMVGYRGKLGLQAPRAAVVTGTVDSLDPRGVEAGQVPALDSDQHVHLWVFTPGESAGFPEFNIAPGFEPGEWSALWTASAAETTASDAVELAPNPDETTSLYRERAHLVAYLAAVYPSAIVHDADPEAPGWPVIYINTPQGQMSWHIALADMDLFGHVSRSTADRWDGHTTEEKYERLAALTRTVRAYTTREA